jgi:hypothetical protein
MAPLASNRQIVRFETARRNATSATSIKRVVLEVFMLNSLEGTKCLERR